MIAVPSFVLQVKRNPGLDGGDRMRKRRDPGVKLPESVSIGVNLSGQFIGNQDVRGQRTKLESIRVEPYTQRTILILKIMGIHARHGYTGFWR
jgi:hypothetical protein